MKAQRNVCRRGPRLTQTGLPAKTARPDYIASLDLYEQMMQPLADERPEAVQHARAGLRAGGSLMQAKS
jgi:hypothetical protein